MTTPSTLQMLLTEPRHLARRPAHLSSSLFFLLMATCLCGLHGCASRSAQQTPAPAFESLNDIGARQLAQGDALSALRTYENALGRNPKDLVALRGSGNAFAALGRSAAAAARYRALLVINPNDVALRADYAKLMGQSGNKQAMLSEFSFILKKDPLNAEATLATAQAEIQRGQREAGLKRLRAAHRNGVRHAGISNLLAIAALDDNDLALAEQLARQSIALDPGEVEGYNTLGAVLLRKGDLTAAMSQWKKASTLARSGPRARSKNEDNDFAVSRASIAPIGTLLGPSAADTATLTAIRSKLNAGKTAEAESDLQAIVQSEPKNVSAVILLGNAQLAQGSYDTARASFKAALDISPKSHVALNNLAATALQSNSFDQAVEYARQSIDSSPTAEAYRTLGLAFAKKGDFSAAARALESSLSKAPDAGIVKSDLGVVLAEQGKFDIARLRLLEATNSLPGQTIPLFNLGVVEAKLGNYRDAASRFSKAALQSPSDIPVRINWGYALAKLGDTSNAEKQWKAALELDSRQPEALNNLGVLALARGEKDSAANYFKQAFITDPTLSVAQANFGKALAAAGSTKSAAESFEAAVRTDPSNLELRKNLASLYLRNHEPAKAATHLQVILGAKQNDPQALYDLAAAYQLAGKKIEARQVYGQFMDATKDNRAFSRERMLVEEALGQ